MAEFFLELFSEEIPARMQARAAEDLVRLVGEALAPLSPTGARGFYGPRRIAMATELAAEVAASSSVERGPRANAPEQALAGFLRKHGASRDHLRREGDFWVLEKASAGVSAASLIGSALPALLRRFPWPKSMRWGGTSQFTWVRPLRRIVCLLDGAVVPFSLADGADDGHGLVSGNLTEGHRFLAPRTFAVSSWSDWERKLLQHKVLPDVEQRRIIVDQKFKAEAFVHGVTVVDDPGLIDEVAGLVEWPVMLIGRIDEAHMDLPVEVMQVSMRVNQRYFALRNPDGSAAPYFAFAANIEATDGGKAIIAGNERVLRARFADARYFWDLDRKATLASRAKALDNVTFHAKLGTQGMRVQRIESLAQLIARILGIDPDLTSVAARLAKADLTTGMVGEFPELQGVMGRYYAQNDGVPAAVADAIRDHYAPKGPGDAVPTAPLSIAVALADKLDQLAGFFAIGEKPTGSGDPYALRRAALGIIRIIRECGLQVALIPLIKAAGNGLHRQGIQPVKVAEILDFLGERLRVQLRSEGIRHDVLAAVFATGLEDDLNRALTRAGHLETLLTSRDGINLLAAYRRADNLLKIEQRRDGPVSGDPDEADFQQLEEHGLLSALTVIEPDVVRYLADGSFGAAMAEVAGLRRSVDAFFDKVTVNAPEPRLRKNRLRLLSRVRATMNRIADFSKIEG